MESVYLTLRVLFSLAVVVVMLWALAHVLRNRVTQSGTSLSVVSRVPVSRKASVALVRLEDRGFLIGVSDQQITLIATTDLPDLDAPGETSPGPAQAASHLLELLRDRTARR
jgi:flagellar protein FliO/FliZ